MNLQRGHYLHALDFAVEKFELRCCGLVNKYVPINIKKLLGYGINSDLNLNLYSSRKTLYCPNYKWVKVRI